MLTHLIYCCIDFYFFTVINNNKKDIPVCIQILVCQEKKKREKEKIKKGHIFFDSMQAMYYCMQPEGRSGVGTPQIAKSFLPWKVVRWMESLLHTCTSTFSRVCTYFVFWVVHTILPYIQTSHQPSFRNGLVNPRPWHQRGVCLFVIFTHRAKGEYNSSSKPMYLVWEWETFFSYDYTVYYPCCWPKS